MIDVVRQIIRVGRSYLPVREEIRNIFVGDSPYIGNKKLLVIKFLSMAKSLKKKL